MSPAGILKRQTAARGVQLSVFPSDLGWFGIVGSDRSVTALTFGHRRPKEVHARLQARDVIAPHDSPRDWWPELQRRLQDYAGGAPDDFADVEVDAGSLTRFQAKVLASLRSVGYSETITYGELADRAGSPRAARAVGRVMATNSIPIIIPCHRVVASGGRIGGYSAPSGLTMKQRLLSLEGVDQFE